jgi:hypothetical protein
MSADLRRARTSTGCKPAQLMAGRQEVLLRQKNDPYEIRTPKEIPLVGTLLHFRKGCFCFQQVLTMEHRWHLWRVDNLWNFNP